MNLPKIEIPKKPTYIHIADDMDFFELFKKLERKNDNCFLFESLGEKDRSSRYSVIGFDPEHIIRAKQNTLYFDDTPYEVENPYFALRDIVPQDIIARKYAGGLVGYMGYDCINYFEPSVSVKVLIGCLMSLRFFFAPRISIALFEKSGAIIISMNFFESQVAVSSSTLPDRAIILPKLEVGSPLHAHSKASS